MNNPYMWQAIENIAILTASVFLYWLTQSPWSFLLLILIK